KATPEPCAHANRWLIMTRSGIGWLAGGHQGGFVEDASTQPMGIKPTGPTASIDPPDWGYAGVKPVCLIVRTQDAADKTPKTHMHYYTSFPSRPPRLRGETIEKIWVGGQPR